jgi:hypothetical protein
MAEYYAWSPILVADDKAERSTIPVGNAVTSADVGGEDSFNELVEAGVLRTQKVPETSGDESPKQAVLRQAQAMIESVEDGDYGRDEVVEAMNVVQPRPGVSDALPPQNKNDKSTANKTDTSESK